MVLVVCERPGELYLRSLFIVTSYSKHALDTDGVLDDYRDRGMMEGRIGEHQSVLSGRLGCTARPKSRIKNFQIKERSEPIDAERANAASLLMHGIAFNLLNTLRLLGGTSGNVDEPIREELLATAGQMKPHLIQILAASLFVATLVSCASAPPTPEPSEERPVTINHRPQCAEYCDVHDLPCEVDTVPVVYGLSVVLDRDWAELIRANPNAHFNVELGCVELPFREAFVLFCPACRSALETP